MKRLWIVFAIMTVMLCLNCIALWHLSSTSTQMIHELEQISTEITQKNAAEVQFLTDTFIQNWHKNEQRFMCYLHHDALDTITGAVARLSALAEYEQYPELAAEIGRIQTLISHMYESEIPNWQNIF